MRTTVRLDEELLKEAKALANETGRTLTSVIEEALQQTLRRRESLAARRPVRLPLHKGKLRPGVDLNDSSSLLDLMDGR
ncbi:MAG: DUF6364 family protein [Acidobacteriota bacterium]